MSSPRHRFGDGSWNHDFIENNAKCPPHFPAFFQVFNHQSAGMNKNAGVGTAGFHSLRATRYSLPPRRALLLLAQISSRGEQIDMGYLTSKNQTS